MSTSDDLLLLEKCKQRQRNERKDEVVLTQVERINDSITHIEEKEDQLENDFQKKCQYYEKEIKLAEASCETEINRLRSQLDDKIDALEKKRNKIVDYYLSQLNTIRTSYEIRKKSYEATKGRKEQRLSRTARKIQTQKGQVALRNEVIMPTTNNITVNVNNESTVCSKEERQAAQKAIQEGASYWSLKERFPNFMKECNEKEKEVQKERYDSPLVKKQREEYLLELEKEKEIRLYRERECGEISKRIKELQNQYKELKGVLWKLQDDEKDCGIEEVESKMNDTLKMIEEAQDELTLKKRKYFGI